MDWLAELLPTIVAVATLASLAVAVLSVAQVPRATAPIRAILRGALQLAALSVVLSGIIANPVWVALGLVIMFFAAVLTASRRIAANSIHASNIHTSSIQTSTIQTGSISANHQQVVSVAIAMLTGNIVVLVIVFATGAIEFSPRYALAIGGIVIGNTMSIASLSGRGFHTSVRDHWDEVEGWLALGARPIESTRQLARTAIYSALVPTIDQTRTTGIVVLPGAFVGAIFGGASPLEAGRFQIVVLAGILAAGTLTSVILLRLIGAVALKPEAETFGRRGTVD
ncbi:ABC transporter permease [Subtercola frigoramans]|uniref:ABC transport system permease protein n=1 Tax=Subtercola frigoramans TaxID=120298 RepID=A0ABS2L3F9_9MICO|nr:ABC transporter permease [Subtercola frigoramans]MBM7471638.1 putative ABC transport system permease protein [Subtercola frigoramans]